MLQSVLCPTTARTAPALLLVGEQVNPSSTDDRPSFDDVIAVCIPNVVIISDEDSQSSSKFRDLSAHLPLHIDDVTLDMTAPDGREETAVFRLATSNVSSQRALNEAAVRFGIVGATWNVDGRISGDLSVQLAAAGLSDVRVCLSANVTHSADDLNLHAIVNQFVVRGRRGCGSVIERAANARPERFASFKQWYQIQRIKGSLVDAANPIATEFKARSRQVTAELEAFLPQRRAELESKYAAAVKALEDYKKEEIARVIDYGLRNSEGVKPIGVSVHDDSIKFTGIIHITNEFSVSVSGYLSSNAHSPHDDNRLIVFTADNGDELHTRTFRLQDALKDMSQRKALHEHFGADPLTDAELDLRPAIFKRALSDQVNIKQLEFEIRKQSRDGVALYTLTVRSDSIPLTAFLECQIDWRVSRLGFSSTILSNPALFIWKWPARTNIPSRIRQYVERLREEEVCALIDPSDQTVIISADFVGVKFKGSIIITDDYDTVDRCTMEPPLAILPELWDQWREHVHVLKVENEQQVKKRRRGSLGQQPLIGATETSDVTSFKSVRDFPLRQIVAHYLPAIEWKNDVHADAGDVPTRISARSFLTPYVVAGVTALGQPAVVTYIDSDLLKLRIGSTHFSHQQQFFIESLDHQTASELGENPRGLEMSIDQLLIAWNYTKLLPLIPQELRDNIRVSSSSLIIDTFISVDDGTLTGWTTGVAKSGPNNDDYLLLVDNAHFILLKIHSRQIITSDNFPQIKLEDELIDDEKGAAPSSATDVFSYVLFSSKSEKMDEVDVESINESVEMLLNNTPDTLLFPLTMTTIKASFNGLLIYQYDSSQGRLIDFNVDSVSARASPLSPTTALTVIPTCRVVHNYSRVLWWLTSSAPSTTYFLVLSYLDLNDIIYGLRQVNQSIRNEPSCNSCVWWKNRLRIDWGEHIVRWSDDVLLRWATDLATNGPNSSQRRMITRHKLEEASAPWLQWPLWYSAAVHLQCRLNRFRHDMLHVKLEQRDTNYNATSTTYALGRRRRRYNIPTCIRDFLLLAPPFLPPPERLTQRHKLCSRRSHLSSYPEQSIYRDIAWFARYERDDSYPEMIGLYLGPVFAFEDEYTIGLGRDAGPLQEEEYNQYYCEPKLNLRAGKRIREFYHIEDDLLPVTSTDRRLVSLANWMHEQQSDKYKQTLNEYYEARARNDRDAQDILDRCHRAPFNNVAQGIEDDDRNEGSDHESDYMEDTVALPQIKEKKNSKSEFIKYCFPRMDRRLLQTMQKDQTMKG